jgi:hypothetical protein
MEYCNGGSLESNLQQYKELYKKPFPENLVQAIMRQVVRAVKYLHEHKIVHRDLKLDNILLNYSSEMDKNTINIMNAEIKIIDFGLAIHITNNAFLGSVVGSPMNMDPRILKKYYNRTKGQLTYDEKADIWSMGTLCYQMLVGDYAFNANNLMELVTKIETGIFTIPITFSKETISFLMGMLQYDSSKRLSAEELSKHNFIMKYYKDFTYIDENKTKNKIKNNNLYLNIRENGTICSIIDQNGINNSINHEDLFLSEKKTIYLDNFKNQSDNIFMEVSHGMSQNQNFNLNKIHRKYNIDNLKEPNISKSCPIAKKFESDPVIDLIMFNIKQNKNSESNSLVKIVNNNESNINLEQKNPIKIIQPQENSQSSTKTIRTLFTNDNQNNIPMNNSYNSKYNYTEKGQITNEIITPVININNNFMSRTVDGTIRGSSFVQSNISNIKSNKGNIDKNNFNCSTQNSESNSSAKQSVNSNFSLIPPNSPLNEFF